MLNAKFVQTLFQFFGASSNTIFELQDGTRPEGVTTIQYNMIEYLFYKKSTTLSELAACMYLSMPNASREVKKLLTKGLVDKKSDDEDRRKQTIFLTDKGYKMMEETYRIVVAKANERYRHLTEADQDLLNEAMALMMDQLF